MHNINEPWEYNVVQKITKEYTQMIPFVLVSYIQKYAKSNNIYLERKVYMAKLSRTVKE